MADKRKIVILYRMPDGTKRFNELHRLRPGGNQRMLTRQLRERENEGMVLLTVQPEVPARAEYSLTEMGRSLSPILASLAEWGMQHMERIVALDKQQSAAE